MYQFGGKDSKRHFTVVMGGKEHGLYVSSTPSSAAKKAVTKLCAANKSKKVEFSIREITQGSKKKTYGPYEGHIEKLKEPIELKGRVIKYKPVAKLSGKTGAKKGGYKWYMVSPYEEIKKFTPAEIQNQENYLKELPEAFKNIIINGIAPNDPKNEQPVYMSKIPITNNDELYSYLSHNYNTNNLKYWCEALEIKYDDDDLLHARQILLEKIIKKLKEKYKYDLEKLFQNSLKELNKLFEKPNNKKSN
jgi:hypothetical protein